MGRLLFWGVIGCVMGVGSCRTETIQHIFCGDGNCEKPESCDSCEIDCGACCGNESLDSGELCDTAIQEGEGVCPSLASCKSQDKCILATLEGEGCRLHCVLTPITAFVDQDGCCPFGADLMSDSDCKVRCGDGLCSPDDEDCQGCFEDCGDCCGNGKMNEGEKCDTAIGTGEGICPDSETCSSDNPCVVVTIKGEDCQAECLSSEITDPIENDGCCPRGADRSMDSDCPPGCPDGFCDQGESCESCAADCGLCPCGNTICRQDQQCMEGACVFPCEGKWVPGDFSTIQETIDALPVGGGTICLHSQEYVENLLVYTGGEVSIVGADKGSTTIQGRVSVKTGEFVIRGVNITEGLSTSFYSGAPVSRVEAVGCRISGDRYSVIAVTRGLDAESSLVIDGCEITSNGGEYGVEVIDANEGSDNPLSIELYNNYFHGIPIAIRLCLTAESEDEFPVLHAEIHNNTVVGCDVGLSSCGLMSTYGTFVLHYSNNVFIQNKCAVGIMANQQDELENDNNLFFENGDDFCGMSEAGEQDLFVDPVLNFLDSPPSLFETSPCRDSGLAQYAPAHDFWNVLRGAKIDRGAVEYHPLTE